MSVRSPEPKGVYSGATLIGVRQQQRLIADREVELVEWDVGVRFAEMERRRQHAVIEREQGLDDSGQTRAGDLHPLAW